MSWVQRWERQDQVSAPQGGSRLCAKLGHSPSACPRSLLTPRCPGAWPSLVQPPVLPSSVTSMGQTPASPPLSPGLCHVLRKTLEEHMARWGNRVTGRRPLQSASRTRRHTVSERPALIGSLGVSMSLPVCFLRDALLDDPSTWLCPRVSEHLCLANIYSVGWIPRVCVSVCPVLLPLPQPVPPGRGLQCSGVRPVEFSPGISGKMPSPLVGPPSPGGLQSCRPHPAALQPWPSLPRAHPVS